ncbi:DUF4214 domain-containing protein [Oerskovia paurometabola]|nr:DUF4214 domain-containing protein [Oerskovia paurometabola]MBM7496429.1 uncharacterized protein with LGFP repeats [Oerskovia paurometabola]
MKYSRAGVSGIAVLALLVGGGTASASTVAQLSSTLGAENQVTDGITSSEPSVTEVPLDVVAVQAGGAAAPDAEADAGSRAQEGPAEGVESVPADGGQVTVEAQVADDRIESPVLESDGFQTLGVTWPDGAAPEGIAAQARTRSVDGEWTAWVDLEISDDAPDQGTAEAERELRGGTAPLWVGEADAVQLAFSAEAEGVPDVTLALVDSPADESASATVQSSSTVPSGSSTTPSGVAQFSTAQFSAAQFSDAALTGAVEGSVRAAAVPTVITRAQWGAAAPICTPDTAAALVGAVVHHTAGPNGYSTVAQAMQQIRNDQKYHQATRGWCDLGYNFIVDKWGNIYEGRGGSLTSAVIGVHAGGFNTGTVGISMLGNFHGPAGGMATTPAMIDAVGRIAGARLGAYNINPQGWFTYRTLGGENSKYPAGSNVSLPRIFGHRDTAYTACPGDYGYAQLDNIRAIALAHSDPQAYAAAQSVVKALYTDLLGRGPDPTGLEGWSAALVSGAGQPELVASLTRSQEYVALRVSNAYMEALGRGPDPVGAQDWAREIHAGRATVDDVKRRFYDSSEFFARAGGTPQGYVQVLYQTMLGRGAAPSEIDAWVKVMEVRGRSRMVDELWFSMEAARMRAGGYYSTFLQRGPDPTGLTAWAQVLLSHGEGAVRVGIAGSSEYRALAQTRFP